MSGMRKLALTAALFAVALGVVALAAAIHQAGPLFGAWAPLLAVPWVLTRPAPGERLPSPEPGEGVSGAPSSPVEPPEPRPS